MAPTGIQKAAALLKALDPDTAGQLLQAAPSRSVPEIAAEILCLGGPGQPGGHPADGPAAARGAICTTRSPASRPTAGSKRSSSR